MQGLGLLAVDGRLIGRAAVGGSPGPPHRVARLPRSGAGGRAGAVALRAVRSATP